MVLWEIAVMKQLVFVLAGLCFPGSVLAAVQPVAIPTASGIRITLSPALEAIIDKADTDGDSATVDTISAYITAHPEEGDAYAVRCEIYQELDKKSNDYSVGLDDCKTAANLAPNSAFVHYAYGDALYDLGQFKNSLAEYSTAIDLGQNDRGIYWKRCDAYRRTGDLDSALKDCNRQIELTPNNFDALNERGVLDVARKDYTGAIGDLTAALKRKPHAIDTLYWRGIAYLGLDVPNLADADLTQCIELGDTSPDTYMNRGWARVGLHEKDAALADWQKADADYHAAGLGLQASIVEALIKNIDKLLIHSK